MAESYNAAMIVIGNEILSGRTQDSNVNYLAKKLSLNGIDLSEVRVVRDVEEEIVNAVNELRVKVDYLFTTGGIGPTNDDITCQSIAKALGVELIKNNKAHNLLKERYGENLNESRVKVAYLPEGAQIIADLMFAAPGFKVDNIYVMAGVPRVVHAMVDYIVPRLKGGKVMLSRTVPSRLPQSFITKELERVRSHFASLGVEIGSFPYVKDGFPGINIDIRCSDEQNLIKATMEVEYVISALENNSI